MLGLVAGKSCNLWISCNFRVLQLVGYCLYQVNKFYLNIFSIGPMLCRDEMEDWSASEANLFEEAIEKYGKDFNDIRKDFLPWKSMKNIIEYFFMWKTTDRFVVIHSFFSPNIFSSL